MRDGIDPVAGAGAQFLQEAGGVADVGGGVEALGKGVAAVAYPKRNLVVGRLDSDVDLAFGGDLEAVLDGVEDQLVDHEGHLGGLVHAEGDVVAAHLERDSKEE